MSTAAAIIRHVESLGFAVTLRRSDRGVEIEAVSPTRRHIARNLDGDGEEDEYRAACRLAEMVGIDLEDG